MLIFATEQNVLDLARQKALPGAVDVFLNDTVCWTNAECMLSPSHSTVTHPLTPAERRWEVAGHPRGRYLWGSGGGRRTWARPWLRDRRLYTHLVDTNCGSGGAGSGWICHQHRKRTRGPNYGHTMAADRISLAWLALLGATVWTATLYRWCQSPPRRHRLAPAGEKTFSLGVAVAVVVAAGAYNICLGQEYESLRRYQRLKTETHPTVSHAFLNCEKEGSRDW